MTIEQRRVNSRDVSTNSGEVPGLPQNPRFIKDAKFKALVKSLQEAPEFMDVRPVICYPYQGKLIAIGGNMRVRAAMEIGLETIPAIILPADTPVEKLREYTIKDNLGYGEWDYENLANEWDTALLADWGMDIDGWDTPAETTGDDEAPEAGTGEPDSQPGEMYELGKHRLYCGDSTDPETFRRLMGTEKADMVFSDPPYGVSIGDKNKELSTFRKGGQNVGLEIQADTQSPDELKQTLTKVYKNVYDYMNDCCACFVCSPQGGGLSMMMMMMMMIDCGLPTRHNIIWVKNSPTFSMGRLDYDYKHEPILFSWKKTHKKIMKGEQRTSVWEYDKPRKCDLHPTMKPVALVENALLNNSEAGDIILDPFGGSGTTMIAAEKTGRVCRMIDLDCHYTDVIRKRVSAWMLENGRTKDYIGSGYLE